MRFLESLLDGCPYWQSISLGRRGALVSAKRLLLQQVRTKATPFAVIDVRTTAEVESQPLPEELHGAQHVQGKQHCPVYS